MKESHIKEECDPEREEVTSSRKRAIASTPLNEHETARELCAQKRLAPAPPMFLKHWKGVMTVARDKNNNLMKRPDSFFR